MAQLPQGPCASWREFEGQVKLGEERIEKMLMGVGGADEAWFFR